MVPVVSQEEEAPPSISAAIGITGTGVGVTGGVSTTLGLTVSTGVEAPAGIDGTTGVETSAGGVVTTGVETSAVAAGTTGVETSAVDNLIGYPLSNYLIGGFKHH